MPRGEWKSFRLDRENLPFSVGRARGETFGFDCFGPLGSRHIEPHARRELEKTFNKFLHYKNIFCRFFPSHIRRKFLAQWRLTAILHRRQLRVERWINADSAEGKIARADKGEPRLTTRWVSLKCFPLTKTRYCLMLKINFFSSFETSQGFSFLFFFAEIQKNFSVESERS